MRKKNYKGRCEKRKVAKCQEVCRTYDDIQRAYLDVLQEQEEIQKIRCNVWLEGLDLGAYTSDFICTRSNGDLMVRERVSPKFLTKPMPVKLLDASPCAGDARGKAAGDRLQQTGHAAMGGKSRPQFRNYGETVIQGLKR